MGRDGFWRVFWSSYARVYDSISHLAPYRQLVDDVCTPVWGASYILDAGCGTGNQCLHLEDINPTATLVGLDRSAFMIRRAAKKTKRTCLLLGTLDDRLPFGDNCFDAVVCCNVLYSVNQPARMLDEFRRVLRPGGTLVCATPHGQVRLMELIRSHLDSGPASWRILAANAPGLLLAAFFNRFLLARVDWTKFHFYTQQALEREIAGAGFSILRSGPAYAAQDWLVEARTDG